MKKWNLGYSIKKGTGLLLTTVMLAALGAQPAFAATSIKTVTVRLNLDLEAGNGLPELVRGYTDSDTASVMIPDNNKYDIVDVEWSKDVEEMKMGDTYKIKITLEPEDDYEFKSSYASSKVTVKGGSYVSARRNSEDQLVVTVKTKEVEGTFEEPDDPRWLSENSDNDKFGYAKWDSVTDAAYDIILYRNDKSVYKVTGWKKTSIDLYPYMTKEGDYTFKVRAVPKDSDVSAYATKSDWNESDELYVDEDEVSDGTGQGQENGTTTTTTVQNTEQVGWILSNGKWFFRYPDGSYLRDSWGKIDEKWYLFNTSGEMLTGWQLVNNQYYYMNQSGAMLTGWLKDNNIWYYLNPDGSMKTGWLTENGLTYYMQASGAMATGWKEVGGNYYYFYPDGHKAVNEVISGFYVDQNGVWKRP